MGFSRQEDWSGLLFPSPGDLPDPGMEAGSPARQADSLLPEPPGKPLDVKQGGSSGTKCELLELTHAPAQGPRACHKVPRLQEVCPVGERNHKSRPRSNAPTVIGRGLRDPRKGSPLDCASGSEWSLSRAGACWGMGRGRCTGGRKRARGHQGHFWEGGCHDGGEIKDSAHVIQGSRKGAATTGEKAKIPLT